MAKTSSLLFIGLSLAAGAAGAQTITQTYANSGSPTGSLSSIGFDSYQIAQATGAYDTTGEAYGAQGGTFIGTGWTAINYVFSNPATPAGYELTSVDLTLFIIDVVPSATTSSFDIYAGLDRSGGVIGSFNLTEPSSEQTFANISIPLSALAGGFSIGKATNAAIQPLFTTYSENYSDPAFHPSVSFTYTQSVPEPASALLAAAGSLGLLRRRRK